MNNILLSIYDPRYFEVILHKSRYLNHIQMKHFLSVDIIREGIEDPDFIVQDVDNDFIENYYALGLLEDNPDAFLKICVLFKEDYGRIITAFDVEHPKKAEVIIWQK